MKFAFAEKMRKVFQKTHGIKKKFFRLLRIEFCAFAEKMRKIFAYRARPVQTSGVGEVERQKPFRCNRLF